MKDRKVQNVCVQNVVLKKVGTSLTLNKKKKWKVRIEEHRNGSQENKMFKVMTVKILFKNKTLMLSYTSDPSDCICMRNWIW